MPLLFDTHAHIMDKRFDDDRETLISELPSRGVQLLLNVGCDREEIAAVVENARKNDFIYAAVGFHPHNASEMTEEDMNMLRMYAKEDKVKAIGEIGLDYHYDLSPRDVQKEAFMKQMELAEELDMPVIIHVREAYGDLLEILKQRRGRNTGVLHCFSGSYDIASQCIDLGYLVSFAGPLTFDNANRLRDVAARLPLNSMVVETDSPYLSPHPMRGRRNDPANVLYVAQKLSEIKRIDLNSLCEILFENGKKLFHIE